MRSFTSSPGRQSGWFQPAVVFLLGGICVALVILIFKDRPRSGASGSRPAQKAEDSAPLENAQAEGSERKNSAPALPPPKERFLTNNRSSLAAAPANSAGSEAADGPAEQRKEGPSAGFGDGARVVVPAPIVIGAGSGATVTGRVTLTGTPPPEREITMDAACGALHAEKPKTRVYAVDPSQGLADVFVRVKSGLSGAARFPTPSAPVILDQRNCEYVPYVAALQTGQALQVLNSDPLLHNVHLVPDARTGNKEANRAQMAGQKPLNVVFDHPELFLTFKCDVHRWMFAYVCVSEHPYFAVTARDGSFAISGLPPGKYVLEAVHRRAGAVSQEIEALAGQPLTVDFALQVPPATGR